MKPKYTSYDEKKDTGPNTPSGMRGFTGCFTDAYGPDPYNKYFSVLLHDKVGRLPKTYVAICSEDTLRDDGFLLVEMLKTSRFSVRSKEYMGFPHYFWTWPTLSLREVALRFQNDCEEAARWLLS